MAEFKIGRLRYTWKGQWATATFYNRDAVVQYGGKTYVCLEPHTAGDFYLDIAHVTPSGANTPYWSVMMEGRSWVGPWAPSTYYKLGQIVTYGGSIYECTTHHTSGTSAIELANWTLYSQSDKWTTNWTTSTSYGVGDTVKYGGIVYRCTVNHVAASTASSGLEADQNKWAVVSTGIEYKQAWAVGVRYKLNDLVKNGADLYIATSGHTSTSTFDLTKWTLWMPGQEGQDTWSSTEVYQLGDVVVYGGYSYISNTTNNTNTIPSVDAVNWALLTTGFNMLGDWDSGVSYRIGDTVRRGGQLFTAIADNNSTDPSATAVSRSYNPDSNEYVGLLEASGNSYSYVSGPTGVITFTTYPAQLGLDLLTLQIGDTITVNTNVTRTLTSVFTDTAGVLTASTEETGSVGSVDILSVAVYFPRSNIIKVDDITGIVAGELVLGVGFTQQQVVVSIIDSSRVELSAPTNGTPVPGQGIDFVGINGTAWDLVVPGINWANVWTETVTYGIGDLVVWKNETHICVRNHTSSEAYRPDVDVSNTYWQHYILHARKNALTTLGDLETYDNGVYEPIHIGLNTEDFVLRTTAGKPLWQYIHRVPKVYYVTPEGLDDETYGDTWDHPWKTIGYACEIVSRGYFNLNAADILKTNKAFMVEEMYQWMLFQKDAGNTPFNSTSEFDAAKTRRDANLVLDAIVYDITRGGNSQTVAATIAYFADGSSNTFYNAGVTAGMPFFIAALTQLLNLVDDVLGGVIVSPSYQAVNEIDPGDIIAQQIPVDIIAEIGAINEISSLMNIVITALTDSSTADVPQPNQGLTATIMVKTGTYNETLPISVPANVALNGDELRGVVVQPKVVINTVCKSSSGTTNTVRLLSYDNLTVDTPIQFVADALSLIGGITVGRTYYVTGVTEDGVSISETLGGPDVLLTDGTSLGMSVIGGDAIKNMFYVRNGCGIRNMTLSGLLGTLSAPNQFTTRRPTGGAFVSLDPGTGPEDTSAWIIRKSPYVQNVTTFGTGCVGLKIDGTLHNGGNKSVVANDFTQIVSDGIGIWCTGRGSLTELVSVFCYYNYSGYFAEDGGRIRATNGNSSYGTFGCIAEGYDDTETPISGTVDNRSAQVQASVQSSFGSNAQLLKLQYANAGSAYNQSTVNLIKYSNRFDDATWNTDGNVAIQQNVVAPSGYSEAWTLRGTTSNVGSDYIYQNISILPAGQVYTNVSAVNVSGSGLNATFNITVTGTSYVVTVNSGGTGYVTGNQLLVSGNQLGGANNTNDCIITVASLAGSSILTVTSTGTVPEGSDLGYLLSMHVQADSADAVEMAAIFSGSSTVTSSLTYTFSNSSLSTGSSGGGMTPATYGKVTLDDGWFRIWMLVYDTTGLNNQLQFRIYPRSSNGASGQTHVYGTQLQIKESLTFYLETTTRQDVAYANYSVVGAGSGADIIGDELRSNSVFQTRITDPDGAGAGGTGYLTASNSSQGGNTTQIILAGSDINLESNYRGMRVFINAGTGAGQYGYISAFDDTVSKVAQVLRETFDEITIITSNAGDDTLGISPSQNTNDLYTGQAVQFLPTYYTTSIGSVSVEEIGVSFTTGGTVNTLTVASTAKLRLNMTVTFSGTVFGGLTTDFNYYIVNIVNDNEIQVSTQLFGSVWALQTATPVVGSTMNLNFPTNTSYINGDTTNMVPNMPIQFTGSAMGGITVGTIYYVNEVVDGTSFTISNSLQTVTATATTVTSNEITAPTASLITFNPIIFTGTTLGGILEDTKYYISKIVSPTAFTVVTELINLNATATEAVTNLITVASTVGLVANNPIQFVGTTFGGLTAETIYYVLAINDGSTFTISLTPGGSAVNLTTAAGDVIVRSVGDPVTLSTDSGSMVGTTTANKVTLSQGYGVMTGSYSTSLFGGVSAGTTYYIDTFDNVSKTITVSAILGGSPLPLTTKTGSMAMGAVGWDHINIGTPIEPVLDSTSLYYIEPRTAFSKPAFTQIATTGISLSPGTSWQAIAYGDNYWMALPNANATAAGSVDGQNWTSITLPASLNWSDIAYGNGYWVAISAGGTGNSKAIRSVSHGAGWRTSNLPSATNWSKITYGNGVFVALALDGSVAYSTNYGGTWTAGSNFPVGTTWSGLCYGVGKFVAVQADSATAAYSTDGINWTSTTMPDNTSWSAIEYGNGRYVAINSGVAAKSAYSFDAITWYQSNLSISGTSITYGQGAFLVLNSSGTTAWTSEGGLHWKLRTVTNAAYGGVAFGFATSSYNGVFATLSGQATGSVISAGAQAKGRAVITSGVITSISQWENGSNYTSVPTVSFTDPNVTKLATVQPRISNGTLGNPTFANRGDGYSTNSTTVTITGSGYADQYQTGLTLIVNNLSRLPGPGDNLVIAGNPNIYKVTSAVAKFGTVAPNIEANIDIAPDMSVNLSPEHASEVTIRQKYSQVRLTGHDFLNIGYGNQLQSNYPSLPTETVLSPQNHVAEVNYGRVFYTSTDQDGDFRVGGLFAVQQATGIVTLSASQFGLTGLETLSLGGIAVGGAGVVITQFSTDQTFVANSNNVVPTQKAIKGYLTSRLSQGGSNTFTGQLIAGTVLIGGPDKISSTIPEGTAGGNVQMTNKVSVEGEFGGWAGDGAALAMFIQSWNHR